MINFLSKWAKGLGLSIVIISLLEMILPNNNTKKYVKVIMGIYLLFIIVEPFIENKNLINLNNIDLEKYVETTSKVDTSVNQTSMDDRIKQLYIEQLEKDIEDKVKKMGYKVEECKVKSIINGQVQEAKITKIKLKIKKDNKEEENDYIEESNDKEKYFETIVVKEIQKIKPIKTNVENENTVNKQEIIYDNNTYKPEECTKEDIQNLKKFLSEEYEVSEKCLEIN